MLENPCKWFRLWVMGESFVLGNETATKVNGEGVTWLLRVYASAVVGRTLTNRVLVSNDFTDESADTSEKHRLTPESKLHFILFERKHSNDRTEVYIINHVWSPYPGWVPGPGRVWGVCCGGRKPSQPQTAAVSVPDHSGPLGWPTGGCPPHLSDTLEQRGEVLKGACSLLRGTEQTLRGHLISWWIQRLNWETELTSLMLTWKITVRPISLVCDGHRSCSMFSPLSTTIVHELLTNGRVVSQTVIGTCSWTGLKLTRTGRVAVAVSCSSHQRAVRCRAGDWCKDTAGRWWRGPSPGRRSRPPLTEFDRSELAGPFYRSALWWGRQTGTRKKTAECFWRCRWDECFGGQTRSHQRCRWRIGAWRYWLQRCCCTLSSACPSLICYRLLGSRAAPPPLNKGPVRQD